MAKSDNISDNENPIVGFNDSLGFKVVEWKPDYVVIEFVIQGHHRNRSGLLHGGVIATLIDAACGYAGCYCSVKDNMRLAVTLSLTTSYIGSATSGTIRAIGKKRGGGRKIFAATAEVFNEQDELLAVGESTYRYSPGSEDEAGIAVK